MGFKLVEFRERIFQENLSIVENILIIKQNIFPFIIFMFLIDKYIDLVFTNKWTLMDIILV